MDLIKIGEGTIGRGVFEPGWKWSVDVKPIAGTKSCQAAHSGYVLSGRMRIVMDDGQQIEVGPGDYAVVPAGHDAWTVGNEACVMLDVAGMENYARPSREAGSRPGRQRRGLRTPDKSITLTGGRVNFSWDDRKAASNQRKHGVSFDEAATVFADPLALYIEDAVDPGRTLLLGASIRNRLLLIVHAELDESTIRIISARRATSHERRRYEEEGQ